MKNNRKYVNKITKRSYICRDKRNKLINNNQKLEIMTRKNDKTAEMNVTAEVEVFETLDTVSADIEGTELTADQVQEVIDEVCAESPTGETDVEEVAEPLVSEDELNKAKRVLKYAMPGLIEARLNFEKRSGSFFKRSEVFLTEKDENGNDKIGADGQPIYQYENGEKITKVVRHVEEIEDHNGVLLPEFAHLSEEVDARRAAALLESAEEKDAKLREELRLAQAKLEKAASDRVSFQMKVEEAKQIVSNFVVPENVTAPSKSVKKELDEAQKQLQKLRALLIAAGIDPNNAA